MSQYLAAVGPYDFRRGDLSNFLADIKIGRPIYVDGSLAQVNAALGIARKSGQEFITDFYNPMRLPGNGRDFPSNADIIGITKLATECVTGKRSWSRGMTRQNNARIPTTGHRNSHWLLSGEISGKRGRQGRTKLLIVGFCRERSLLLPLTRLEVDSLAVKL